MTTTIADPAELVRQSTLIPGLQKAGFADGAGNCTTCHHDVFTDPGTDRCEHVHRQAQGIEPSNAPAPTHRGTGAGSIRVCTVCGEPLISSDPTVTTHPNCVPEEHTDGRSSMCSEIASHASHESQEQKNPLSQDHQPVTDSVSTRHKVTESPSRGPVSGAKLLSEIRGFLETYVVYPGSDEAVAHTLWVAHTWFMDLWTETPRLYFKSPQAGSGKSRALEVTIPLVPNPVESVNATPAYLFRKVSAGPVRPTIMYDEIDTVYSGGSTPGSEDLRGFINAGHRVGATAGRCVKRGETQETEELPAYCAVLMCGLGSLPDTIETRSVIVAMRKRKPSERQPEKWRARYRDSERPTRIREDLETWSKQVHDTITAKWPEMPEGVEDRDADVWEALLAVADAAGGIWPDRAREAAVRMVSKSKKREMSLPVVLLRDIRAVFTYHGLATMKSETLCDELAHVAESPWKVIRKGEQISPRYLSTQLREYGIEPTRIHPDAGKQFRGYRAAQFEDAWERYLESTPEQDAERIDPDTMKLYSPDGHRSFG